MEERLQKILSAAGIASRRAAEDIILEGRVRVNGKVVTELGAKADPDHDHVKVDGKLINPKQPKAYIMLNKPAGFVTTMSDPEGRPIVAHLLKGVKVRVYPVGRLDYDTEGLLLLTNDGDFAHLVTHPRHELPKTYLVKVKGFLEDRNVENLEQGVFLKDGRTAPAKVRKLRKEESNSWVEITIHEGRKRQVRRMIDFTGHSVIKLKRTKVGNLNLGDLPVGAYRHLTLDEVRGLREMATQEEAKRPAPRSMAQKKSEEARVTTVRREADDAQKRETGFDDSKMWGRGEEKRRSRVNAPRSVAGARGSIGERHVAGSVGQRTPRQGNEKERGVRGGAADQRPRSTNDRRPAYDGKRTAAKTPWKEQHGSSRGPGRPSGERPRPSGARATDQRGPRQDERGARVGSREPVRDKMRAQRPAFVGKVYGTRNQGPARSSSFKPAGPKRIEERPRPSTDRAADHRVPRQDERVTRAVGREPGSDEKRSWRPASPGKMYGTRKRGPVSSGFKPGGPKRPGARPSRPRPSGSGSRGGRRS
jgi:23S rRNA pseudouridine2605 synthase